MCLYPYTCCGKSILGKQWKPSSWHQLTPFYSEQVLPWVRRASQNILQLPGPAWGEWHYLDKSMEEFKAQGNFWNNSYQLDCDTNRERSAWNLKEFSERDHQRGPCQSYVYLSWPTLPKMSIFQEKNYKTCKETGKGDLYTRTEQTIQVAFEGGWAKAINYLLWICSNN